MQRKPRLPTTHSVTDRRRLYVCSHHHEGGGWPRSHNTVIRSFLTCFLLGEPMYQQLGKAESTILLCRVLCWQFDDLCACRSSRFHMAWCPLSQGYINPLLFGRSAEFASPN